jgi:glycosyltransferase involved in cell wall biosynthesis
MDAEQKSAGLHSKYLMKRILIFSTDDHLVPAGGAEQAFGNITERLPHIEFDLVCAKLRKGASAYEKVGNINIHRVGFGIAKIDGLILALFGHMQAYKLMKSQQYDLIWSIMASYGAFAAVRVKKKTGIPFLLTLQEGDSFEYIYKRVRFVRKAFNKIFTSADGIQAISNYLLTWGRDMGYAGQYGKVIPNGVAIDLFTQDFFDEVIKAQRESFGFRDDALILFTSSRLEKKNGIEDVIRALPLLPAHVCFVVCGSGSLEESLKLQVRTHGLQDRVRFMGFVDPKELPLLMKASDIFIRPSLSEGLGNAFLEAMAAHMFVIGTAVGGIPDFLVDGKTGFVVQTNDPQSIADAIKKIHYLDNDEGERILKEASDLVVQRYNWNLIAKDMETLFTALSKK